MNIDPVPMSVISNQGLNIAFFDVGPRDGIPVLLIHGFASTAHINWVYPGWVQTLTEHGYRVIALDNRGHGESDKPHEPALYTPPLMASDATSLLDHLGVDRAFVIGYSMGARLCAYFALQQRARATAVVFGGLGAGMVNGVGDWDVIARALLAPTLADVIDERGRMFRAFADQTKSDRQALAACIQSSRTVVDPQDLKTLVMPALVAVGTKDDIAGSPDALADLLPNGRALHIQNRDHQRTVGDRHFKAGVLAFFEEGLGA